MITSCVALGARLLLIWLGAQVAAVLLSPSTAATRRVGPADDLGWILSDAGSGDRIELAPGEYHLRPHPLVEPTCGNCEDPTTPVAVTVGALIAGRRISIWAPAGPESTVIHTHAGYGILFDGCWDCGIEGVTLTGGERDADGNATDAAVVVKHSKVRIANCHIRDNIGETETVGPIVVGIIGIAGREGSRIEIEGNRIIRNSWDGIALYRGANATIRNNVIDGIDRARGKQIGGGRGVGIGVTWDARAVVEGNLVRNYWKGIGLFVDADGTVEQNIVENVLAWGISLWDAGKGRPRGQIRDNAVYQTGACGIAVVRSQIGDPPPGFLLGNALVRTGQDPQYDSGEPYCLQTALAEHDVPPDFRIADNLFYENREPGDEPGTRDISEGVFLSGVATLCRKLAQWRALYGSEFLVRFGN
jgi:parallel beta-helix repeat protein